MTNIDPTHLEPWPRPKRTFGPPPPLRFWFFPSLLTPKPMLNETIYIPEPPKPGRPV